MRIAGASCSALALIAALAPAAHADDLSGAWTFSTQPASGACVITGEMRFMPAKAPLAYSCAFTTRAACAFQPAQVQLVEESCTVKRSGGDLLISSKVGRIADAGPPTLREALMAPNQYYPDDFTVHAEGKSGDLVGFIHDPVRKGPVRFKRRKETVS